MDRPNPNGNGSRTSTTGRACSIPHRDIELTETCPVHGRPKMQRVYEGSFAGRFTWCPDCESEKTRHNLRQSRRQRRETLRDAVYVTIPPRYRQARLCHISRPVREAIQRAPADAGAVLFGPVGAGKTYTLAAFARHWIVLGDSVRRASWDGLLRDVRSSYSGGSSEESIIGNYTRPSRLIVEDLGASTPVNAEETAFSVRILTAILDYRLEQCRPTYITTNRTQRDIGKSFDARVASRLQLLAWIGIGGRDNRTVTR